MVTGRIASIRWQLASVPFVAPFVTAGGTISARETVVIELRARNGAVGYGEATPWPPFGQGTVADAAARLAEWAPLLLGHRVEDGVGLLATLPRSAPGGAAACCALDLALHDLWGHLSGQPVSRLLGGGAVSVPLNAVIGGGPPQHAAEQARAAVAAGYRCVKVKVATGSLDEDEARVALVRQAIGPATRLRLDANGGWSEPEACAALARLEPYQLELLEEPVSGGNFDAMKRIRSACGTPIAADESVHDLERAYQLLDFDAADVLVIKPMVVGGLVAAREIMARTLSRGLGVIVTTSLGFGFEIAGALHLAATLPQPVPPCGLATANLLTNDLTGGEPTIHHGAMRVPGGSGLGVTLDREALERYAVGPCTELRA